MQSSQRRYIAAPFSTQPGHRPWVGLEIQLSNPGGPKSSINTIPSSVLGLPMPPATDNTPRFIQPPDPLPSWHWTRQNRREILYESFESIASPYAYCLIYRGRSIHGIRWRRSYERYEVCMSVRYSPQASLFFHIEYSYRFVIRTMVQKWREITSVIQSIQFKAQPTPNRNGNEQGGEDRISRSTCWLYIFQTSGSEPTSPSYHGTWRSLSTTLDAVML